MIKTLTMCLVAASLSGIAYCDDENSQKVVRLDPALKVEQIQFAEQPFSKHSYSVAPGDLIWSSANFEGRSEPITVYLDELGRDSENYPVLYLCIAYSNSREADTRVRMISYRRLVGDIVELPYGSQSEYTVLYQNSCCECKPGPGAALKGAAIKFARGVISVPRKIMNIGTEEQYVGDVEAKINACIPAPSKKRGPVWRVTYSKKITKEGVWTVQVLNGDREIGRYKFRVIRSRST